MKTTPETRQEKRTMALHPEAKTWLWGQVGRARRNPLDATPAREPDIAFTTLTGSLSLWRDGDDAGLVEWHHAGELDTFRWQTPRLWVQIDAALAFDWAGRNQATAQSSERCAVCGTPATMHASRGVACADHYDELSD